ncbi:HalX domain-containing protein [Halosegnis marinus]|uniref:HalX domain-containing protein n=1 Tax=Halosegnis marinus TaxID=3034023 RepID=A0ABD5ZSA3_9EURY|nr:HalX domain-containing protein [Halosegnis sp. DT85]
MTGNGRATVLVVDDEAAVAEGHAAQLSDEYEARVAIGGHEALSAMNDGIDVVLLDRRMPDLDGEAVLERLREGGYDCRVAMLTGVDPDFDIIDMGFDDYLKKPVSADALNETVGGLLRRSRYDTRLRRYFSLASKVAVLETEHDRAELAAEPDYVELCERLAELRAELDDTLDELSTRDGYAVAAGGSSD